MAKKKDQRCPHGYILGEGECRCFGCKMDYLRSDPEKPVKAGEFVEIIDQLLRQIEDVRDQIPREYDPQCE